MGMELIDPRVEPEESINISGSPVQLVIGFSRLHTFVHPTAFDKASDLFKDAVTKGWLRDDDVEIVMTYVRYLYTERITCEIQWSSEDRKQQQYIHLAELYAFAEKYSDTEFQNKIIDCFAATTLDDRLSSSHIPKAEAINFIYNNTAMDSPAQKMLVDLWLASKVEADEYVSIYSPKLDKEFLMDLEKAAAPADGMGDIIPCNYHKHVDGITCLDKATSKSNEDDSLAAIAVPCP